MLLVTAVIFDFFICAEKQQGCRRDSLVVF